MSDGLVTGECFLVGDRLRVCRRHFGDSDSVGNRGRLGSHRRRDDLDGVDWRSGQRRNHRRRDNHRRSRRRDDNRGCNRQHDGGRLDDRGATVAAIAGDAITGDRQRAGNDRRRGDRDRWRGDDRSLGDRGRGACWRAARRKNSSGHTSSSGTRRRRISVQRSSPPRAATTVKCSPGNSGSGRQLVLHGAEFLERAAGARPAAAGRRCR